VDGLPEQARTRRAAGEPVWWGFQEELLAQLVEVLSVLVSDHRFKEPLTVPRPYGAPVPARPKPPSGFQKMLSAATQRGMVHHG